MNWQKKSHPRPPHEQCWRRSLFFADWLWQRYLSDGTKPLDRNHDRCRYPFTNPSEAMPATSTTAAARGSTWGANVNIQHVLKAPKLRMPIQATMAMDRLQWDVTQIVNADASSTAPKARQANDAEEESARPNTCVW